MKKYGSSLIIGVDAGYGNMKTAGSLYPTGLTAMDTEPMFEGDILKYNGVWYRIGEGHKPFIDDKTEDDDFYILTLASVACELSVANITRANVILAVGLPTTWTKRQKKDYREYMLKNQDVQFTFRKKDYRIHFSDCLVFPQGYSAAIRRIDDDKQHNGFQFFNGLVMMADIGNGTMNIMRFQKGKPDERFSWTEKLGVNQCVLSMKKRLMDAYGLEEAAAIAACGARLCAGTGAAGLRARALRGLQIAGRIGRRIRAKIPRRPVHLVGGGRGGGRHRHRGGGGDHVLEALRIVAHIQPVLIVHQTVLLHIAGSERHAGSGEHDQQCRALEKGCFGILHMLHSIRKRDEGEMLQFVITTQYDASIVLYRENAGKSIPIFIFPYI